MRGHAIPRKWQRQSRKQMKNLVPPFRPLLGVMKRLPKVMFFQIEMRGQNGDSWSTVTFARHSIGCSSPQTPLSSIAFSTGGGGGWWGSGGGVQTQHARSSHTNSAGGNKLVGGNPIFTAQSFIRGLLHQWPCGARLQWVLDAPLRLILKSPNLVDTPLCFWLLPWVCPCVAIHNYKYIFYRFT